MELLFIIPLIYAMIGSVYARRSYALERAALEAEDPESEVMRARQILNSLSHSSDCWRGSYYNSRTKDCDCRHKAVWKENKSIVEGAGVSEPTNPYFSLGAWPYIWFDSWLKGGKVSPRSNPHYTKMLERQLGIESGE